MVTVAGGGPADRAGLKAGDVITSVGAQETPDTTALSQALAAASPGDQVTLTVSRDGDNRDVQACYQAGASSYIQKPVDLDGFMRAIERLNDYWFEVVILPRS